MTHRVGPRLRDLTSADAVRILDITRATGVFREEELAIADEVFHDAVAPEPPGQGRLRLKLVLGAKLRV